MTQPSDWFDPITSRIDDRTGLEITAEEWARWEWLDVTTMAGYVPGAHRYIRTFERPRPPIEYPEKQVSEHEALELLGDARIRALVVSDRTAEWITVQVTTPQTIFNWVFLAPADEILNVLLERLYQSE